MPDAPKFYVGQEVLLRSVNDRRDEPRRVTIAKVGRTNVYYADPIYASGLSKPHEVESGRIKDNYGHEWLQTPEEYAEEQYRTVLVAAIRAAGWEPKNYTGRGTSTALLEALAGVLGVSAE